MILTPTKAKDIKRLCDLAEAYKNLGFDALLYYASDTDERMTELMLAVSYYDTRFVYGISQRGEEYWFDDPEFLNLPEKTKGQLRYLRAKFFDEIRYEGVIEFG